MGKKIQTISRPPEIASSVRIKYPHHSALPETPPIYAYPPPHPLFEDPTGPLIEKMYPDTEQQIYFNYKRSDDLNSLGFWVEARILGKVIVFDRGSSGTDVDLSEFKATPLWYK
ncbi:hypothetical protein TWF594_002711 [Orbilia oligospora]|nr:hypothetical protein TWF594_002711 [Orbilia oligospora]